MYNEIKNFLQDDDTKEKKKLLDQATFKYADRSIIIFLLLQKKKTNAKGKNCNFSRPSRSLYKIDSLMPENVRLLIVLGTLPCVD